MMKQSRATIRYAKSLLNLSEESGVLDASYNDMVLINSICSIICPVAVGSILGGKKLSVFNIL